MKNILDYSLNELEEIIKNFSLPSYRAKQVLEGAYNGFDFSSPSLNLPKNLISMLEKEYFLQSLNILKAVKSADGTIKFLFKLNDENIIEGVLMKYKFGNTVCISTQVGCRMQCTFCASGQNGLIRNLTAGEIIGQLIAVNNYLGGNLKNRLITNVVLMGSGEPLDNYDNTLKFLYLVTNEFGFNISARNITISSCGLAPQIKKLSDEGFPITLALSLHASNDETRKKIMPVAKGYSLKEIIESAKYFNKKTSRRIIIEYTLINKVNDSTSNAQELSQLLKGLQCHVNLIKLNEVKESDLKSANLTSIKNFLNTLKKNGISATVRRTLGDDITAACGQLRNQFNNGVKN